MNIREIIPSPIQRPLRYVVRKVRLTKRLLVLLWTFFIGYCIFWWRKSTPTKAYHSMRELYCLTNGRFNKLMGSLAGMMYPPYRIDQANGILGNLDQRAVREIVSSLRETGFYIFHKKLPTEICDELMRFALTTPARPFQTKYVVPSAANGDDNGQILYDRQNPVAVWYHFDQQRIYENPVIQPLATDLSVLAVAQAYLSCQPIQDSVTMWWSTSMLSGTPAPLHQFFYLPHRRQLRNRPPLLCPEIQPEQTASALPGWTHLGPGDRRTLRRRGPGRTHRIEGHHPGRRYDRLS
jgi:hypothetical protein